MPNTPTRMLAENASEIVSTKRDSTFSSMTMRGKAMKISDGIGTMKRLIRPSRINTSTRPITTTSDPTPRATGSNRDLASAAALMADRSAHA